MLLDDVGCCLMMLDDIRIVWPFYPTKSQSRKHNSKSPSRFEFIFLRRGKLRVRFAKGGNQISKENY